MWSTDWGSLGTLTKKVTVVAVILALAAMLSQLLSFQGSVGGGGPTVSSGQSLPSRAGRIVLISPRAAQTVLGLGASGAWWSGPIYGFGAATRAKVGQLLFSSSGLELSDFRYNLGGGGVGVTTPWKAPPNLMGPRGTIDLSKDPAGLFFLEQAHSYGVRSLTGFVNSAPRQFVSNGANCGGTLLASKIPAFAHYLTAVSVQLHRQLGINLNYVSPMNEPAGSQKACRQEGMAVPVSERANLVITLGKDLARSAPWSHVMADESSTIVRQATEQLPKWAFTKGVSKYLAVFAHHGYDFPTDEQLSTFASLEHKLHRPSWSTEICCYDGASFGYQYDPTITSGIWLAHYIYQQFTFGGDSGFDWWTALSPDLGCSPSLSPGCFRQVNALGRNDGLVYYDLSGATNGDRALYKTKRYFVFGNFSRYIRPGYRIHKVTGFTKGIEVVAANKGSRWVVVLIDHQPAGSRPLRVDIELPLSHGIEPTSVNGVVTSATQSWANAPSASIVGTSVRCIVDSQSVTTYAIEVGS